VNVFELTRSRLGRGPETSPVIGKMSLKIFRDAPGVQYAFEEMWLFLPETNTEINT